VRVLIAALSALSIIKKLTEDAIYALIKIILNATQLLSNARDQHIITISIPLALHADLDATFVPLLAAVIGARKAICSSREVAIHAHFIVAFVLTLQHALTAKLVIIGIRKLKNAHNVGMGASIAPLEKYAYYVIHSAIC
jgi:hypothetical protein